MFDAAPAHRLHRMRAGLRAGAARRSADRADRAGGAQQGSRPAHRGRARRGCGARSWSGSAAAPAPTAAAAWSTRSAGWTAARGAAGRCRADRRHRRRAPAARADGRGARCSARRRAPTPTPSRVLERAADRVGAPNWTPRRAERSATEPGAGAAGGIGAALLALGGRRESGAAIIAEHTRLADDVAAAELVITGEGRFDDQSLHGKVVSALAAGAGARHAGAGAGRSGHAGRRDAAGGGHRGRAFRSPTTPDRCSWPSTTRQTSWPGWPARSAADREQSGIAAGTRYR